MYIVSNALRKEVLCFYKHQNIMHITTESVIVFQQDCELIK